MTLSDNLFNVYKRECLRHNRESLNISFLEECKRAKVIPNFLTMKNKFMRRVFPRQTFDYEFACLSMFIRIKYSLLATIRKNIRTHSQNLRGAVNNEVWCSYQEKLARFIEVQEMKKRQGQNKKLGDLMNKHSCRKKKLNFDFINLSSRVFSTAECEVLNKGPKFVLERCPTIPNMIPQLEDVIRHVDQNERFSLRNKMFYEYEKCLKRAESRKHKKEYEILNNIKNDSSIVSLKTDKTNKFAILNASEYMTKMNQCIKDLDVIQVRKDPLNKIIKKVKDLIKDGHWPADLKDKLKINKVATLPVLFARIKDHKPNLPLRPIVDRSVGPLYSIEKALVIIFKQVLPSSTYAIDSTKSFIERLKNTQLPSDFKMATLDVVALYPSVDVYEVKDYIISLLHQGTSLSANMVLTLTRAINLVIFNNYFKFNGEIYLQTKGAPMGSPISGLLAEYALRPLENTFISNANLKPTLWQRYVDDIFIIWEHGPDELVAFHEELNKVNKSYKFTMEIENNNKISFLDVLLERKSGNITRSVYRKPIASAVTIPAEAYTAATHKSSAYRAYIKRAKIVCSDSKLKQEYNNIRSIAKNNGFTIAAINRIIKSEEKPSIINTMTPPPRRVSISYVKGFFEKIRSLLKKWNIELVTKPEPKLADIICHKEMALQKNMRPGVYEIPYTLKDGTKEHYIGVTSRALKTRLAEHKGNIRTAKLCTALARKYASSDIIINFDDAKIIRPYTTYFKTLMSESIEIFLRGNKVCNDKTSYEVPKIWLEFMKTNMKLQ